MFARFSLDRRLFDDPAFERANAALLRIRDKVDKLRAAVANFMVAAFSSACEMFSPLK